MGKIRNLDSIQDYNEELGVKTLHPLVNVVDFSELESIPLGLKRFGFYCVFLKHLGCGALQYGRNQYDYREGTLVFIAPGQVAGVDSEQRIQGYKGWCLMFHPDLLFGTPLARRMGDYSFFAYSSNEALHMSDREQQVVINCFREIREELGQAIDKHTKQIVAANIEVFLNHCVRFYDRQFVTREVANRDVLTRFEALLPTYFASDKPERLGIPTVAWCAEQVHLSPNYFGDLIKKETGSSAQDYIQRYLIERIKEMLLDDHRTMAEIAYALGFKYPHHMTRLFKKGTGMTPLAYRMAN